MGRDGWIMRSHPGLPTGTRGPSAPAYECDDGLPGSRVTLLQSAAFWNVVSASSVERIAGRVHLDHGLHFVPTEAPNGIPHRGDISAQCRADLLDRDFDDTHVELEDSEPRPAAASTRPRCDGAGITETGHVKYRNGTGLSSVCANSAKRSCAQDTVCSPGDLHLSPHLV